MLVGLGALSVVGCGSQGGAMSAEPGAPQPLAPSPRSGADAGSVSAPAGPAAAPTEPARAPARAVTVVPGVSRAPRAPRVAFGGAGLGQLRQDSLRIWRTDGSYFDHALERASGIGALPDGALVAIGQRDARGVALIVAADGAVEVHPVLVLTTGGPLSVLADLKDTGAFWLIEEDRGAAERRLRVEAWGELDISERVKLDNPDHDAVAALPSGLVFHHLDAFQVVDRQGRERRVPWRPSDRVAALVPWPKDGMVWALSYDGVVSLVELGRGDVRQRFSSPPTALDLAADAAGVAVLSATWAPIERERWTLTVLDDQGAQIFTASEPGAVPMGVALSADVVAVGDATRLRVWERATGRERSREG